MITIPTLEGLNDQILNDIATEFNVDVSELGKTYRVLAAAQAGVLWTSYLTLSDVQQNVFYDLAEESMLIRYGIIILGRTIAPAEAGEYEVEVTGQIGAVIKAGTQYVANDDTLAAGSLFVVDADFTLIGTTDTLPIRSLEPGTQSALSINDLVSSTAPIVDVTSEAKTTAITKQAVAAESVSDYRADVVAAARIEPQGGSPGDYRLWSLEIPEVRTTYPYAKSGNPGDIEIYIEATKENTAPAEITGVPTQATIDEVYTAQVGATPESGAVVINPVTSAGRKPIGVFNVFPLPVNPLTVDVKFIDLSDETIAEVLKINFDTLLYNIRPFVAGADILSNKNDILTIGQIIAVIVATIANTGITYTNVTMQVDGDNEESYQFLLGDYPYLRYITNNGIII